MSTEVTVLSLPKCSFCPNNAEYDARTKKGYWAYLCPEHYKLFGLGLGTGLGQKLVLKKDE